MRTEHLLLILSLLCLPVTNALGQDLETSVFYTSGEEGYTVEIAGSNISILEHAYPKYDGQYAIVEKNRLPYLRLLGLPEKGEFLFLRSTYFCIIGNTSWQTDPMINGSRRKLELRPAALYDLGYIRPPDNVTASTTLAEKGSSYDANNLKYVLTKGPWVAGDRHGGVGEWVLFDFHNPYDADGPASKVNRLLILNGYISVTKPYLYEANSRAKTIRLSSDDPIFVRTMQILDSPIPQIVDLPMEVQKVKLEILEYYPGSKWNDLCISLVWGINDLKAYFRN